MMHYAATHGILAPRVFGVYDIVTTDPETPISRVMVSERVPGVRLSDAWDDLTASQKEGVKNQLREQLARMRTCTQPFIGRVDRQHARSSYDQLVCKHFGPFENEEAFDEWCFSRFRQRAGPISLWRWKRFLEHEQQSYKTPGSYVLTHGDLSPRNIMIQDGTVTGIVDWEFSGVFPEYAEYAFAIALRHGHEKWWIPVLKEILQPCSKKRLKFTRLAKHKGW